jgi:hypothetical protein
MGDTGAIAAAYWEHHRRSTSPDRAVRTTADDYEWASTDIDERIHSQPVEAIELLMEIADGAPSGGALAYLGAGPIEDLIRRNGTDTVIDGVEAAARRSSNFRTALRCAWYDDDVAPDVRDRLRRFGSPT